MAERMQAELPHVLFVDDEPGILNALKRLSYNKRWVAVIAHSTDEAFELLNQYSFNVVVSDMRMPNMCGDEFLSKVRDRFPFITRILLTGFADIHAVESSVNQAKIFNFISKPWDDGDMNTVIEQAIKYNDKKQQQEYLLQNTQKQNRKLSRLALLLNQQAQEREMEVKQALSLLDNLNHKTEEVFFDTLSALTQVLDWKEGRDSGHSDFVKNYAIKIAKQLNFSEQEEKELILSAMLQRIGTVCLPDELRIRPVYSFSQEERVLLQRSATWGEIALANTKGLSNVAKIIGHQNENVDGSGYPDNLRDDEIPLQAKLIRILGDFFDLSNGRLERNLSGYSDAKRYINEWKGKIYSPALVEAFWQVLDTEETQQEHTLTLSTSELNIGMTLHSDLYSPTGILLLAKGSELTALMIEHLRQYEKEYQGKLFAVIGTNKSTLGEQR